MLICFICSLLDKTSLATQQVSINHTIKIAKKVKKPTVIKTFLFGWIKIVKDKMVTKLSEDKCDKLAHVCCDHRYVSKVVSYKGYDGKKPIIEKSLPEDVKKRMKENILIENLKEYMPFIMNEYKEAFDDACFKMEKN